MARIRSIKPEFWTDSKMVALPPIARLFFIGLWNFADDYGVLEDDADSLKLRVMPADAFDAATAIDGLVERGRLRRCIAPSGAKVLVIAHFGEHQKIDKRAAGKWGDPADWPESPPIPPTPTKSRPTPPLEGKGREGRGKEVLPRAADAAHEATESFNAWWDRYPRKVAKKAGQRAWRTALKLATVDELTLGLGVAVAAWEREGRTLDKIPYASTWLNGECWTDQHGDNRPAVPRNIRQAQSWLDLKGGANGNNGNGPAAVIPGRGLPAPHP